jgi:hypothetical protein
MAVVTIDKLHAMCGVAAAAAPAIVFTHNDGFTLNGSSHALVGLYSLVFDDPVASHGGTVNVTAYDATGNVATVDAAIASLGNQINLSIRDKTGALSDAFGFTVTVLRMPYAEGV